MKKIITVLLSVLMLFSVVACAKTPDNNKVNSDVDSSEEKIWTQKDLDYEGYVFTILAEEPLGSIAEWDGIDIDCDELTGNEVLDEVYNRNKLIETQYNCTIEMANLVSNSALKTTIMGGSEEDGAMISHDIRSTFALVEAELLMDLNDPSFTHLNLKKDWYSQTIQRDTMIAGKLFFVNGDMLFTDETAMWVTIFNKKLASQYVTDVDLYEAVRAGKWTVDMLTKYAALATTELKADDKMTYEDQWGYIGESPNVSALVSAAGHRYASITADGGVVSNVFNEDFQKVYAKSYETVDRRYCLLARDIVGATSYFDALDSTFYEGRALFMITGMNRPLKFREMETDFGILPLPKNNEAQTEYYTWTTYNTNVVSIPYSCSDPERTSAIMEALFEESSYALKSAYIDKAVKYQSTRDDDSVDMLDIIINSTVYDIGVVYDFGGTYTELNNIARDRSIGQMTSKLQKIEAKTYQDIDALLIKFGYKKP